MNNNEKLLLLQLILEDIRGNWASDIEPRVNTALDLCNDLMDVDGIDILKETISSWNYNDELIDGRYFRCTYPNGYEGMNSLHNLTRTYYDKSESFKNMADVLTYPEYRFTDISNSF